MAYAAPPRVAPLPSFHHHHHLEPLPVYTLSSSTMSTSDDDASSLSSPSSSSSSSSTSASFLNKRPRPTLPDITIPPPIYYKTMIGMTRVFNRLANANRLRDPGSVERLRLQQQQQQQQLIEKPNHVVVNIGPVDVKLQMKKRIRALRRKQARCAATVINNTTGVFNAHPAIYFTIAVFVFCVGGLRAWPY